MKTFIVLENEERNQPASNAALRNETSVVKTFSNIFASELSKKSSRSRSNKRFCFSNRQTTAVSSNVHEVTPEKIHKIHREHVEFFKKRVHPCSLHAETNRRDVSEGYNIFKFHHVHTKNNLVCQATTKTPKLLNQ